MKTVGGKLKSRGGMDGAGSRNRMSRTNSLYLSTGAPDKQQKGFTFLYHFFCENFHLCLPFFNTACILLIVEDIYRCAVYSFQKKVQIWGQQFR